MGTTQSKPVDATWDDFVEIDMPVDEVEKVEEEPFNIYRVVDRLVLLEFSKYATLTDTEKLALYNEVFHDTVVSIRKAHKEWSQTQVGPEPPYLGAVLELIVLTQWREIPSNRPKVTDLRRALRHLTNAVDFTHDKDCIEEVDIVGILQVPEHHDIQLAPERNVWETIVMHTNRQYLANVRRTVQGDKVVWTGVVWKPNLSFSAFAKQKHQEERERYQRRISV